MMRFDDKYFRKFKFSIQQITKNLENAYKDLKIAKEVKIPEVRFNYTYTALIKGGIALLSYYQIKIKSVPGHHVKIIEQLGRLLGDDSILDAGNVMRTKRNTDFYEGGIEVTATECREYLMFTEAVLMRIRKIIHASGQSTS